MKKSTTDYLTSDYLTKEKAKNIGSFWKPREIAIKMAKLCKIPKTIPRDYKILDPCVGGGNLFVAIKEVYPHVKNRMLYGVDIDPKAIKLCMKRFPGGHFQLGNVLEDDISDDAFWEKSPLRKYRKKKRI